MYTAIVVELGVSKVFGVVVRILQANVGVVVLGDFGDGSRGT